MTSQARRAGRKRANSADNADAAKRSKTENGPAEADDDSKGPSRKTRGRRKRDLSVGASDAPKKRKLQRQNGIKEPENGDEPDLKPPTEVRPALGETKLVQAVPAASDAADNTRNDGQNKVRSWKAFKLAALKLKEAGHSSVKIEIDENTSLSNFFPLLPRSIFQRIPFKKCALEYRFSAEGDKPAGASLVAEVELKGPLGEVWEVFNSVLGQNEPCLRVTAFLGVTLDNDKDVEIESLTLAGCFVGCNIQYPADSKLIRITSLGATISITKDGEPALVDAAKAAVLPDLVIVGEKGLPAADAPSTGEETDVEMLEVGTEDGIDEGDEDGSGGEDENDEAKAEEDEEGEDADEEDEDEDEDEEEGDEEASRYINYSLFGTVELPVPGQPLALALDLDLSIIKNIILFTMSPKGKEKAWDNVFGFDHFDLKNVLFKAGYPLGSKSENESNEDPEKESNDSADKDKNGEDERTRSLGPAKDSAEEKREAEEAKKEKEFKDLMGRFEMKKGKEEDDQAFIALQAGWESSIGEVTILGKITKDFVSSKIKGTLHDVTFKKIKQLFEKTHNVSLGDTDIDIQAKKLTVELSKDGLQLEGDLTIYGKEVAAKLLLSTEGVSLTASTPKWEVDDEKALTIEDAEVSFFVGCMGKNAGKDDTAAKAMKKSVGWYGGLTVKGTFTYREDLKITVSLQIVRKAGGGWGYIVMGQAESDLSLADLVHYCPKDGDLDFSLKKIWLVASNIDVDPTMLPPDAQQFPVKKGIFLCTYLETVPLIDGKSNLVKKADPKDTAYLYLGIQSGGLPSVAIYLPKTMSVELGSRVKVGDFYCRISAGFSGPKVEFIGHCVVTMEADRKLDFELMLEGDAIGGKLALVMDGVIENPFGLSKRIALGATGDGQKLGIQISVIWTQLAATGMPAGLGLSGTLCIDYKTPKQKTYGMTINLSENPMDFIIVVNATSLSYFDLVNIASALTDTNIPAGDASDASFRNLEIYASLGGSFGSQTYPPGLRMRGIMSINGKDAFFSCDISISGLKLLACIPSFEIGCLKLTGEKDLPVLTDWPVAMQQITAEKLAKGDPDSTALVASQRYEGKYALLDLEITLSKQSFLLNGKIEIFSLVAYADIMCQYKPEPRFSFDFLLQWNDLVKLQLHAQMLDSKYLDRPRDADFEVSAVFEQTIIEQIIASLTEVLNSTSKTLSEGVNKVKAELQALEDKKRALMDAALEKLRAAERDLKEEKAGIERRIQENKQRTLDRGRELEEAKAANEAEKQRRQRVADEEWAIKKREAEERKNRREAEENARVAEIARKKQEKISQKAQQERNMVSAFGAITVDDILRQARSDLDNRRRERDYWDRRVDEIDGFWHPLDESEARANLTALVILVAGCETALDLLERIVHSQEFKDASNFLDELDNELTELGNDLADNYEKAKNAVKGFAEDLDRTIVDLNHEWKTTVNEVQGFVDNASLELTNFVNEQKAALDNLTCDLQNLLNGVKAQLVKTAQEEVEKIKNDDTLLVAANKGLDSFDSLQQSAFDSLNNIMKDVVGNLVDIQHISLDGTITADAKKQTPFVITIRGKFGGKRDFEFKLEWVPWRPGADDMALFKRLSTMLMSYLNGEDVGLSKEPPKTISQEQVTRNGDMKVDTQDPVDEDEYGIDSLMQEPVKTDELNGWLAERVDVGED